jgi:hypothetical protein
MIEETGLDVIVRFHDTSKLRQLNAATFSLAMQSYRPLHIRLVTQRLSSEEIRTIEIALSPIVEIPPNCGFSIHNWLDPEPVDARSALVNFGMAAAQNRYLALLDYDDVIYPDAYRILIERLRKTDSAIAFGGIIVKEIYPYELFEHAVEIKKPFSGTSVHDLFTGNFCPVHSFVLDRSKISSQLLFFEPLLAKDEDYDFLLRVCAQSPADFELTDTTVGEYRLRTDGSNTILTASTTTSAGVLAWRDAEAFIEGRRRTTPISAVVQASLGIVPPISGLTIRNLLDRGLEALRLQHRTTGTA